MRQSKTGGHVISPLMKDDFRRPKTPVGPKIVRWTKNGDWPFPRFEVFADISIESEWVVPRIRAICAVEVVPSLALDWQDKRIAQMNFVEFHVLHHFQCLNVWSASDLATFT